MATVQELRRRLDESALTARDFPHREKYLLIVNDFLRRLLDLHVDLVDQVERDFRSDDDALRSPQPTRRA